MSVCDPLMSKPAKQLRVVSDMPVPIYRTMSDKQDKMGELQPNEVVSYVDDPSDETSGGGGSAHIWYKLVDDRGWVFTKFKKKKADVKALTSKADVKAGATPSSGASSPSATTFEDEFHPLQPFVRARSVDVRFAPGSGFTENERICVSMPGVGAELQSSVGYVKAVNDNGSVDFVPDDGAATNDR